MEFTSRTNTIGSAIWLIWVWCVPLSVFTVAAISFSFALLQILKAITLSYQVKRVIPYVHSSERSDLKKDALSLIITSLPFYWLLLLETLQGDLSVLILAQRSSPEQVGLYNVGFRLLRPLRLLFLTNISVLYPYLSKVKQENPVKYMRAIERVLKTTLIIGSLSAFIISLLRTEVVVLLFGEKYSGSADALAYQCWYINLWAIMILIGTSLLASDRQRLWAVLTTVYTIFVLPIIWFTAAHGATVLASGIAVAIAANLIFIWPFFKNSLPSKFQSWDVIRSFAVLGIAILCSWLLPGNISLVTKALISCVVFCILVILLLKEWKQKENSPAPRL
jgi:O-antigen/teichoic acid export membrane protein